jgi:hypothetical protein
MKNFTRTELEGKNYLELEDIYLEVVGWYLSTLNYNKKEFIDQILTRQETR